MNPLPLDSPEAFRDLLRDALGQGPEVDPPLYPLEISQITLHDGVMLREFRYRNGFGEEVFFTIAEPPVRRWPHPVLAIHQTNEFGRREVFGLEGDPQLEYGLALARRGHRVVAPDLFLTGDREPNRKWDVGPFYSKYPDWSMAGKMLRDLDDLIVLLRRDFSESKPLYCIGHSIGGVVGYFLAALRNDIARLVSNAAYYETAKHNDPWQAQIYTTRFLNNTIRPMCIAKHTDLLLSLASVSTDVLLLCYRDDTILHAPLPTPEEIQRMKTFSSRTHIAILDGNHEFPPDVRKSSYNFLETGLFKLQGMLTQ